MVLNRATLTGVIQPGALNAFTRKINQEMPGVDKQTPPKGIFNGLTQTDSARPNASVRIKHSVQRDDPNRHRCPNVSARTHFSLRFGPKCVGPDIALVLPRVLLVRHRPSRQRQIASFSPSHPTDTPLPPKPQPWRWTPPPRPQPHACCGRDLVGAQQGSTSTCRRGLT
jgi:hypothetical protein